MKPFDDIESLQICLLRGFRVLRLYGNDPRLSHGDFLMRCKALGLKVVVVTRLSKAVKAVELNQLFKLFGGKLRPFQTILIHRRQMKGEFIKGRGFCEKADEVCSSMIWCVRV